MRAYRVSHVEAFRKWEEDEDSDLDSLVAQISGQGEESEAMRAGTAFHYALETARTGTDADTLEALGYRFTFSGDFSVELPATRELRASKVYTGGRPIRISGQVDAIDGNLIIDHKTTRRFDPERYLAGCQWKLYLSIFGAAQFRWNIFEIGETDEPKVYEVYAHHRLEQWRYAGMEDDCARLVERFARFVRERVEVAA